MRFFLRGVGCDTSGVSTFKYNQCTLVKVKGKFWEINSKRKGSNKRQIIQKELKEKEKGVKSYSKIISKMSTKF